FRAALHLPPDLLSASNDGAKGKEEEGSRQLGLMASGLKSHIPVVLKALHIAVELVAISKEFVIFAVIYFFELSKW
ncbi:10364_t:CDS:2, partial [Cetraspora pellucida]